MRSFFLGALVVSIALSASPVAEAQGGQNPGLRASDSRVLPQSPDNRFIIEFHRYGPDAAAAVRAAGGRVMHEFPQYSAIAAYLPPGGVAALASNGNVSYIEIDPRRYLMGAPSPNPVPQTTWADDSGSPYAGQITPYGIKMVQANDATAFGSANVSNRKVCIIDTGYDLGHPDLPGGTAVTGSDDLSGAGPWAQDGYGHGTHVAGTIAALNNSVGVVGAAAHGITLHIVRVFGDDGAWAYSSDLAHAAKVCVDNGANVISMSLGGGLKSRTEQRAFDDAYKAGVLSVAAAGNGGNKQTSYPAGYGSVISVAAVDNTETVASFSQKNRDVELAAPGVAVLSTVPYKETNTLTVNGTTYWGNWIEYAYRTDTSGVAGTLVNGNLCDSVGSWSGKVVLCQRGTISFYDKVMNVQAGGGAAAVIYNNASGNFFGTLSAGNSSNIPAISLSMEDGQALVAGSLGSTGTVVSNVDTNTGGYEAWDGTSMATPHVSGVAALIWSFRPTCSNAQVRTALQATALDMGTTGRDTSYGYGIVRAANALTYLNGLTCP